MWDYSVNLIAPNLLVWRRQLLERLKHLGLVCKSLTIPPACYPIPVQSLCIQTNAAAANHTILKQELAACDGMVVRQLNVDAEYKSKRVQHQITVMQAYRHDYKLPDKDWLSQSKELLSIMKARLTPIWFLADLASCIWDRLCDWDLSVASYVITAVTIHRSCHMSSRDKLWSHSQWVSDLKM